MNVKILLSGVTSFKSLKLKALLSLIFLGAVACSTGHCRRDGLGVLEDVDAKPPTGYTQEDLGSITVVKPDGSLQCEARTGIPLDVMARQDLPGVEIIESEKRPDGLMRIQVCGTETGILNTYKIKHKDLLKAQKAGFIVQKKTDGL